MKNISTDNLDLLYKSRIFILFSFLFLSVFDPSETIIGAKLELFALYGMLLITSRFNLLTFNIELITIISLFILIPGVSILNFYINGGGYPYDGFLFIKGYFFCILAFFLFNERSIVLNLYCKILTLMAMVIILIAIVVNIFPITYPVIYSYGYQYGVLSLDTRAYSENVALNQIYYVTSPLLIISLGYYFTKALYSNNINYRKLYLFFTLISFFVLILAGSRNNILLAFIVPASIYFFFSKSKVVLSFIYFITFLPLVYYYAYDILLAFLDPDEVANNIKIGLMKTYISAFSNPASFLLGDGIGSSIYWDSKQGFSSKSEFSFIEIVRNFGLIGSTIIMTLILVPAVNILLSKNTIAKGFALSFFGYLILSFTNPNFFNSMGMTVFAILLSINYKLILGESLGRKNIDEI